MMVNYARLFYGPSGSCLFDYIYIDLHEKDVRLRGVHLP